MCGKHSAAACTVVDQKYASLARLIVVKVILFCKVQLSTNDASWLLMVDSTLLGGELS